MPRANRCVQPGHVRHNTFRRRQKAYFLKFARNRQYYLRWHFEARKVYGPCVLNDTESANPFAFR